MSDDRVVQGELICGALVGGRYCVLPPSHGGDHEPPPGRPDGPTSVMRGRVPLIDLDLTLIGWDDLDDEPLDAPADPPPARTATDPAPDPDLEPGPSPPWGAVPARDASGPLAAIKYVLNTWRLSAPVPPGPDDGGYLHLLTPPEA